MHHKETGEEETDKNEIPFNSVKRIVGSCRNEQYRRADLHCLTVTFALPFLSIVTLDKLTPLRLSFFISKIKTVFISGSMD